MEWHINMVLPFVIHQEPLTNTSAVVKQGELLESLEEGNQQPSIYRNIYEGSTTNERDLTCNDEVGNFDTSALPDI